MPLRHDERAQGTSEMVYRGRQYVSQPLGPGMRPGKACRGGCQRADLEQPIELHCRRRRYHTWRGGIHRESSIGIRTSIRDANTTSVPTIVGPTQLFDIVGQTVGSANCKTRGCEVSHGQRAPHNVARAATRERANILHIIKCPKEDEHREREYQPSGSPQRGLDEPVRIRAGSGATIRGSTRITAYPATDPAPKPGAKIRMGR